MGAGPVETGMLKRSYTDAACHDSFEYLMVRISSCQQVMLSDGPYRRTACRLCPSLRLFKTARLGSASW
eukprot:8248741-Alexandrium_andersonii.AAC.1